jgi:UDP-2,3-diacylglucosamine pyrophosphatase LpxH
MAILNIEQVLSEQFTQLTNEMQPRKNLFCPARVCYGRDTNKRLKRAWENAILTMSKATIKNHWEGRMSEQNFISKILCMLGGDRFTPEGTREALKEAYDKAKREPEVLDVHNGRYILFSDHHRGAKNRADDFHSCEAIYCAALAYYLAMDYSLCVMGDVEELWEERPSRVLQRNEASFSAERLFHEKGRYRRLRGNHDDLWAEDDDGKLSAETMDMLQPHYGDLPLRIPEAILLYVMDGRKKLGEILLIHGHQGTQNAVDKNKQSGSKIKLWFSKFTLRYLWRPLQQITGFSCNTPATAWELRDDRDLIIRDWAEQTPGLIVIAGHTHAPVFTSRSHHLRLLEDIYNTRMERDKLSKSKHKQRTEKEQKIAQLSAELEWLEHKMPEGELKKWNKEKADWDKGKIQDLKPCYFNTGCCSFADGKITGIEIADGNTRLVRFPNEEGKPYPKVLQLGNLSAIFKRLTGKAQIKTSGKSQTK